MRATILFLLALTGTMAWAQGDKRLFKPSAPDTARKLPEAVLAIPDTAHELTSRATAIQDSVPAGVVTIHQSTQIASLMTDYAARERPLAGYRIQVFIGDRNMAESTRRAFLLKHPEVPAYLSYLAPNFRIRVGDLRDRVSAEKLRAELKAEFPGSYVVPDEIELPRLVE